MKRNIILLGAAAALSVSLIAGCTNKETSSPSTDDKKAETSTTQDNKPALKKLTVSYAGGTCEAPEYVAYHKGFFKEEGLQIDFVKADFDQLKTGIATGKIDASVGNFSWFKPIEQGLKVKLTAGIHAGCIQAVAPQSSGIKTLKDLKGKTIGVDAIGGGPMIILSSELYKLGINPKTDVQWKVFPPPQLETAVEKKEIDAFIVWDPFGGKAIKEKNYTRLLNISSDEPYKSGYCCYVVVSEKLAKDDPKTAAAYTRAVLKAAEWVGNNIDETSKIEVDNKYVAADLKQNTELLSSYVWKPGVKNAEENIKYFITEQKKQGILDSSTDEKQLFDRIFAKVLTDYNGN
ncbi:MAG TPA: ABC transporter substrate-binding protein [Clostridia bacterium]